VTAIASAGPTAVSGARATAASPATAAVTALKRGLAEPAAAPLARGSAETALAYRPAGSNAKAETKASTEDLRAAARLRGYQGDACGECGNFTLVRNGTCLKCDTCGATTGCS
jgi:ribonucleoside-diphosphate reductase alpha chain